MPEVFSLFRNSDHYRPDAFLEGLGRHGYTPSAKHNARPGNVLLIWNRKGRDHRLAQTYEAAGGTVIVAENGYITPHRKTKTYAIALNHHNGAGTWPVGGPERWDSLGIEIQPWRTDGDHILLLPQRGIGEPSIAMPRGWPADMAGKLSRMGRRVVIRQHPGPEKSEPYEALKGAWAAVTWASGAGIKALVAGVPVFHGLPSWIGAQAACGDISRLADPPMPDRLPMLRRLAWSQWTLSEIQSGEPFAWLLQR